MDRIKFLLTRLTMLLDNIKILTSKLSLTNTLIDVKLRKDEDVKDLIVKREEIVNELYTLKDECDNLIKELEELKQQIQ